MKTVSYELALELKEVAEKHGVVLPESHWDWSKYSGLDEEPILRESWGLNHKWMRNPVTEVWYPFESSCSTHTADELMDWLPNKIDGFEQITKFQVSKVNGEYFVFLIMFSSPEKGTSSSTLADALAQMAIWLIENGYVK